MSPTTPRESRKASSSSPRTTIFFGSPSGSGSSSDRSTGIQNRRNNSPMPVPGPDSVRNLLSSARSMADPPDLFLGKIGADAGRRQRENGFVGRIRAAQRPSSSQAQGGGP